MRSINVWEAINLDLDEAVSHEDFSVKLDYRPISDPLIKPFILVRCSIDINPFGYITSFISRDPNGVLRSFAQLLNILNIIEE